MIESIRTQADKLKSTVPPEQMVLWLFSAIFYAIGWLCGFVWRAVAWIVAAVIAGFKAGAKTSQ